MVIYLDMKRIGLKAVVEDARFAVSQERYGGIDTGRPSCSDTCRLLIRGMLPNGWI